MTQQTKHGTIPPESDFQVSASGFARIVRGSSRQIVCRVDGDSIFFYSKMAKKEIEFPFELVMERLQEWRRLHARGDEVGHPLRG